MRMLAVVVLAAACGGSSKPAHEPTPAPVATPEPAPAPAPAPNPEPAPAAPVAVQPAPPPRPAKPALDRLRDEPGELHGMPGWSLKRIPDNTVCGGIRIGVTRSKLKLTGNRLALSKVYALVFPADLNFDENNPKANQASMKKFNAFIEELQKVGKTANDEILAGITGTDPETKAVAAARVAQVALRMASLIARAPIPKNVRSDEFAKEKTEAYCDKLEEVAEPLVVRAEEALQACADAAAPAGWYTPLCARP